MHVNIPLWHSCMPPGQLNRRQSAAARLHILRGAAPAARAPECAGACRPSQPCPPAPPPRSSAHPSACNKQACHCLLLQLTVQSTILAGEHAWSQSGLTARHAAVLQHVSEACVLTLYGLACMHCLPFHPVDAHGFAACQPRQAATAAHAFDSCNHAELGMPMSEICSSSIPGLRLGHCQASIRL